MLVGFVQYLSSPELLDAVRLDPNAFKRNRKLPFATLIVFLLSGLKGSLQSELNAFFPQLQKSCDLLRTVSAQAVSKSRKRFSFLVFSLLNQRLVDLVESTFSVPRWQGFRVVAGDASKLRLFLRDVTKRQAQEAIAFALYLPGLEMSLAFQLYSPSVGERQMLFEQLGYLRPDDLLVLDRGYPGNWLIAVLTQRGYPFCMRVDGTGYECVKAFKRSGRAEQIVTLGAPNRRDCRDFECRREHSSVRLIRVITPNGRQYVLMTSLLDATAFPAQTFADLYHSRWRIEEAFKRIKHRLNLEHLSGISWLAAQQDFGAKILCDNLNALAVFCATEHNLDTQVRAGYRINRTYTFAHLKRCLPRWLLSLWPTIDELVSVFAELARNLIRIVKGLSKPRPIHPKPHKAIAYKSTP